MRALLAVFLAAFVAAILVATARVPRLASLSLLVAERAARTRPAAQWADRRLSLGVVNEPGAPAPAIGAADHARIAEALARAGGHVSRAKALLSRGVAGKDARALREGEEALGMAESVFGEAKALIAESMEVGDERSLAGEEDAVTAKEDEDRALDIANKVFRHLYEEMNVSGKDTIGFSECQGRLVKHCKTLINRYLRANGYLRGTQKVNIQSYRKRPVVRDPFDEGSNKVIIMTDTLGDSVDKTPDFPAGWTWNGRTIGPWPTCVGQTPEACCLEIKNNVTDADEVGRLIECQFYVPQMADAHGVHYPQPMDGQGNAIDGIIMYESIDPDGNARVEEVPYIQASFM